MFSIIDLSNTLYSIETNSEIVTDYIERDSADNGLNEYLFGIAFHRLLVQTEDLKAYMRQMQTVLDNANQLINEVYHSATLNR